MLLESYSMYNGTKEFLFNHILEIYEPYIAKRHMENERKFGM